MRFILASALAALAMLGAPAIAQPVRQPTVQPALDGVFAAFRTHPLVGLSDRHQLTQAGAFYVALVRDPRFAREVGNVVVEFGGAAHQVVIDRYVNGEAMPYEDLRRVWTDLVGWGPEEIGQMYPDVFAAVRAANANLPPERRIRVWLGEPPIDWTKVATADDVFAVMPQRDTHPAALIVREILGKRKKALVIYGGAHFFAGPPLPTNIKLAVEKDHAGAFFIASIYAGGPRPACVAAFESRAKAWSYPVLATPIAGTWVETALRDPACVRTPPTRPSGAKGPPPPSPEQLARRADMQSGVLGDAILYLGPAAMLTTSPRMQDLYLDDAFRREIARRKAIMGEPPTPDAALDANTRPAAPYDPR